MVNQTNQVSNDLENPYDSQCSKAHVIGETDKVKESIKNSFTTERYSVLKNNQAFFVINIYYELDGKVKEVWFRVLKNTLITPQELARIEKNLKTLQVKLKNQEWDCASKVSFHHSNRVFRFE